MIQPLFSIIIPTYNRNRQLESCLESLTRLDYPRANFEVIVSDDGSEISAQSITDLFKEKLLIRWMSIPHQGPSAARNAGAKNAAGKVVVFIDDDCLASPDWLKVLEKSFQENPDSMIAGCTENAEEGQDLYSKVSQALMEMISSPNDHGDGAQPFFPSCNLAVPSEMFKKLGGFAENFRFAEDREFCRRWTLAGCKINYEDRAIVFHARRFTFSSFLRQHFNYGRGAFQFYAAASASAGERVSSRPVSFYLKLLGYYFSRPWTWHTPALFGLLVSSQAAVTSGYLYQSLYGPAK